MRATLPEDLSQIASGGAMNLGASVVSAVATFLLFLVAARMYDTAEVGAFLVGVAVFIILINVLPMGAQVGLVRFIPRLQQFGQVDRVRAVLAIGVGPVVVVSVLAAVVLALTAPSWAWVFGRDADGLAVTRHLRILAVFVPVGAVTLTLASASQGFGTMLPAAVTEKTGRPLGQLLLVAATATLGAGALDIAYGLPYVVTVVVLVVWIGRLVGRASPTACHEPVTRALAREFWVFAAPRGLASTFQVAILWTDTILLGVLATASTAGIYSVATRYLTLGSLAIGAMLQATSPRLASILAAGDHERAQSVYRTITWWIVAGVWPIYLVIASFHEPLLRIFGPEYLAAGPAVVVLALAMMLGSACGPVDVVLLMGGKSWLSLVNWGMGFAVNIALNVILIPRIGMVGAAIAWMASIVVRNVIPLFEVRALMQLDPFGSGYLRVGGLSLALFGGLGLGLRALVGANWWGLVALLVLAVPVYGIVLYRWRRHLYVGQPSAPVSVS